MLTATFCHIKGLSPRSERKLWTEGVLAWNQCLNDSRKLFSPRKTEAVKSQIAESLKALELLDLAFFISRLPPAELPRVYPHISGGIAYLDIETTGLDAWSRITTIAVYDGTTVRTFVRGKNLDQFPAAISSAQLLVTYNGTRFDLPFIRNEFGIPLNHPHLDLMRPLRKQGFKGGLKNCERMLGIRRQVPEDMDGFEAVRLWHAHERGHKTALPRLLAYNAQDVLSLELLLIKMYNLSMTGYPLFTPAPLPPQPKLTWPEDYSSY
jgi:uncharacterized protein YprB with RNaseH-like and TPR domain